jgi:UDP-glucose 4-epimerase
MKPDGLAVVTGGAGFIGSHLVEALLSEGLAVRVVDNLSTGHRSNLDHVGDRYEWLEGDVGDFDFCRQAVAGASFVFHQAAIPSVPRSVKEPLQSHASGPTATLNVLEAARQAGVRRVMFAASSSAYGDTDELPKHESMLPRPLSPYAAGKLAGEYYVRVYAQTMGLDGVSLRYFNIFGPRQDPSSPYGFQSRDFTYVANAVRANMLAMRAQGPLKGEVMNIGTGRRITLLELVIAFNRALGTYLEPELKPARAGDVLHSQAALDLARALIGYEPVVDFEQGLERTLASFRPAGSGEG